MTSPSMRLFQRRLGQTKRPLISTSREAAISRRICSARQQVWMQGRNFSSGRPVWTRRNDNKEHKLDVLRHEKDDPPLSLMPTPLLLRSLFMTYCMSSSRLLDMAMLVMARLSTSKSRILNPDKNPFVKRAVRLGCYDYFAGGENLQEVQAKIKRLRQMGYHGAILSFAKEVITEQAIEELPSDVDLAVKQWKVYNLRTLEMLSSNDVLAIKYTGAGNAIAKALRLGEDMPYALEHALDEVLGECLKKGVRVFIDAEQQVFQDTVDKWTVSLMRRYNTPDKRMANGCLVYTTLQAYLKKAPSRVVEFLKLAQTEGWTLGLKLVRGAYLSTDKRSAIHDTKEQTDATYDSIIQNILLEEVSGISKKNFPDVQIFVATHNEASVLKALALAKELEASGRLKFKLDYGQLMGMADELGCRLIQETRRIKRQDRARGKLAPNPLKLTVWGSPQECMQWLIRRAVENRDAIDRAALWRSEFSNELWRRIKATTGR